MKKLISLLCLLHTALCSLYAQYVQTPSRLTNVFYSAMSPNGKYAAGADVFSGESVSIYDLETKKTTTVAKDADNEDEVLELGAGANTVSNDGVVLISTLYEGTAAYIEGGKKKFLPLPQGVTAAYSNSITPDGQRIAGTIGTSLDMNKQGELMQRPVIWERQANGTYSAPVELPYPKKDFTGRLPQYVFVEGISADGKTLACVLVDYFGELCQPMILQEDADGNWAYTLLGSDLLNPNHLEFPEYPGEAPSPGLYMTMAEIAAYQQAVDDIVNLEAPKPTEFMTPENRAAYEAATTGIHNPVNLRDYMSDAEYNAYLDALTIYYQRQQPKPEDFMTAENREKYLAHMAKWEAEYKAFTDVLQKAVDSCVTFILNPIAISQNGRYFAVTGTPPASHAANQHLSVYVFDLQTGDVHVKSVDKTDILALSIADDGRILAAKPPTQRPGDNFVTVYIGTSLDSDLVPLHEYFAEHAPETYEWMKGYMLKRTTVWDDDLEEDVQKDCWATGAPCCDAEMKTVITWADASALGSAINGYSYIMPLNMPSGINRPTFNTSSGNGIYYDLLGRPVANPTKGIYIRNNKKVVR